MGPQQIFNKLANPPLTDDFTSEFDGIRARHDLSLAPTKTGRTAISSNSRRALVANILVLLIGGPGQGKSTLGQLACQQYRAGLMRPWQMTLPARQQDLIESFFSSDDGQAPTLPEPTTLCLPLQIILPDFIGWLTSKNEEETRQRLTHIKLVNPLVNDRNLFKYSFKNQDIVYNLKTRE